MDNLISWIGGKLVDGDQAVLMVPLMAGDKTLTRSKAHSCFRLTRKQLNSDYISQPGNVDGVETRVYSQKAGGLWYIVGDDDDDNSSRWWQSESQ